MDTVKEGTTKYIVDGALVSEQEYRAMQFGEKKRQKPGAGSRETVDIKNENNTLSPGDEEI